VFNVGQLRRARARERTAAGGAQVDHSAAFFSHENAAANESREQLAQDSLEQLLAWLKEGGNVGIHDATNSSVHRRCARSVPECAGADGGAGRGSRSAWRASTGWRSSSSRACATTRR
jgi:hypothetical protein